MGTTVLTTLLLAQVGAGAASEPGSDDDETTPEGIEFFERHVRPVLVEHCFACHGPEGRARGGLRLTDRASLLAGGSTDAGFVPGDADASLLVQALRWDDPFLQMPPDAKLPDEVVERFETWVEMGAPWPGRRTAPVEEASIVPDFDLAARRASHWCWQPVGRPEVPELGGWGHDPIDAFIGARLASLGLRPAAPASDRDFVRRVTFDLTGLPPTPEEVAAYVADDGPDRKQRLVRELLGRPAFGEHWATHWLDRVRYAESLGHEFDFDIPEAWGYRDYLVRALNDDVPYDRLVAEHLAGDRIAPRVRIEGGSNEALLATQFWWFGEQTHSPVDVLQHTADRVDNQIDVASKAFLGLTVSCARCHDHMFDAISQQDYFAWQGIVRSSQFGWATVDDPAAYEARVTEARAARGALDFASAAALPLEPSELTGTDREVPLPTLEDPRGWAIHGAFPQDVLATRGSCVAGDDAASFLARAHGGPALDTGLLGPRVQARMHSPEFEVDRRYLHVRTAGKGARLRLLVDGFQIIRDPLHGHLRRRIDDSALHWQTFDLGTYRSTESAPHRASLVGIDAPTPSPGEENNGHDWDHDLGAWLVIERLVLSDDPEPSSGLATALGGPDDGAAGVDHDAWQAWLAARDAIPSRTWRPGMVEGTPHDLAIHRRGSVHRFGDVAPRRTLTALLPAGANPDVPDSGRAHLAASIIDPMNPLTARVAVNRLWHHLFGRGIVATTDNFGALGAVPSHPQLLDHLATRFVEGGWSQKALVEAIVLSDTYGQACVADPEIAARAADVDPENAVLHRHPVKRLTGEQLRDAMLAVAGRLDSTRGGTPVPTHLTEFLQGRGRPAVSGPLDGGGRRTIYLAVRRNFLSPFLTAFDRPAPFSCVGRRNTTNVPAQALLLLNDPFVHDLAGSLAERVLEEASTTDARLDRLFELALGRAPRPAEADRVRGWVEASPSDVELWTRAAHLVFNLKAFRWLP